MFLSSAPSKDIVIWSTNWATCVPIVEQLRMRLPPQSSHEVISNVERKYSGDQTRKAQVTSLDTLGGTPDFTHSGEKSEQVKGRSHTDTLPARSSSFIMWPVHGKFPFS